VCGPAGAAIRVGAGPSAAWDAPAMDTNAPGARHEMTISPVSWRSRMSAILSEIFPNAARTSCWNDASGDAEAPAATGTTPACVSAASTTDATPTIVFHPGVYVARGSAPSVVFTVTPRRASRGRPARLETEDGGAVGDGGGKAADLTLDEGASVGEEALADGDPATALQVG